MYSKEQRSEYNKKYYERTYGERKETRERFFMSLRKPCQKCGESRLYLIQFHHINPSEKEFGICSRTLSNYEKCKAEAEKCVCLCSNCHDEFHYLYGKNPSDPIKAINKYLKGD